MDYTIKELAEVSATQNPGIGEENLKQAEQALGGTFPNQYRELMKLVNQPEFFDWNFFSIKDAHHPGTTFDDIVLHNTSKQRPKFIPADFIVFAESVGDYLCFKKVDGAMEDTVYILSEETERPEAIAPDLKAALLEIISYAEEDADLEHLALHENEEDED